MATIKGALLEELVRAYFARQGFFVLRSVPYRFDEEDVTDLDVWFYSRQAASARIRAIVDVKNKRSPKAMERILWVKGIQVALNCDRAIIATTDNNPKVAHFAQSQKIQVLSKGFLERLEKKLSKDNRLTLEEFESTVQQYVAHKQDGDWLRIIGEAKSAVACMGGFPAFNRAMFAFRFFGERAEVRLQHRDIALRCALQAAALACISLDAGLERVVFEDGERRYSSIIDGINYGDDGDNRVLASIQSALAVLTEGLPNGRTVAAQAQDYFDQKIAGIRADIIAEHFSREHNAQHLFSVAKELDEAAHEHILSNTGLSVEARTVLGVFADFVGVKRTVLPMASVKIAIPAKNTAVRAIVPTDDKTDGTLSLENLDADLPISLSAEDEKNDLHVQKPLL
ncbi:MAG: hypothetical protein Q7K13_08255 [Polynucleobacter sp.]|uniref:hypothetical protein n=1 Tax=Polynucleobacter sp. TaxID=2029855 RepID=UPI00271DFBD4|nr:hypothetical protein [Polynucleobacter sp.]MDO8714453.1 hypothetical protein [Polynucleobacter sp.]